MADLGTPTAASVAAGATAKIDRTRNSGEALEQGDLVTVASDGKVYKCDQATSGREVARGYALNATTAVDQPVAYVWSDIDYDPGLTLTVGELYIAGSSAAPGEIAPCTDHAVGERPVFAGVALAADSLSFNFHVNNSGNAVHA